MDENPQPVPWYFDDDRDGYAEPELAPIVACEPPTDQYVLIPIDCDDSDPSRGPLSPELSNVIDDNCNGVPDFVVGPYDTEDDDRDGVAEAACGGTDCDDRDPATYPGAEERVDGRDNDCDGRVDESAAPVAFFRDLDGDGFGDPGDVMVASTRPAGYVVRGGDCDDADARRFPGNVERCDGVDNDCDLTVDEAAIDGTSYCRDADADGFGSAGSAVIACAAPAGFVSDATDCDDREATTHPGAPELCNAVDDDCDSATDEDVASSTWYRDVDMDGVGTTADTVDGCAPPTGYVGSSGDCDDGDAGVFPGNTEICDDADQDWDTSVDEDVATTTWYRDLDTDGYGDPAVPLAKCDQPAGYVADGTDCDDALRAVNPGAVEVCSDFVDNDCDSSTDEAGCSVGPGGIAGLQLWFDARTAYTDAGVTLATDAGQQVARWSDLSGNGRHGEQPSASNRPTYLPSVAALNGEPAIQFVRSGSQFLPYDGSFFVGTEFTVFAVLVNQYTGGYNIYLGGTLASSSQNLHIGFTSSATFRVDHYGDDWSVPVSNPGGTAQIMTNTFSTTSGQVVYQNGAVAGTRSALSPLSSYPGSAVGRYLTQYLEAQVAEILVYDRVLAQAEREQVQCYLAARYARSVSHACP